MLEAKVCPVPRCHRKCGTDKLMCGPCWAMVPKPYQRDVHRTYAAWRRNLGDPDLMRTYRAAADAAIGMV